MHMLSCICILLPESAYYVYYCQGLFLSVFVVTNFFVFIIACVC
jgi:hypothetical protein